jgi:hypothetical protein
MEPLLSISRLISAYKHRISTDSFRATTPSTDMFHRVNAVMRVLREGDILCFNHRTSVRSQWIKRITHCEMPHFCVYAGAGRILGMLRGRVRFHRLGRFYRPGYDIKILRGIPEVLQAAKEFINRRESKVDLVVIGTLTLFDRAAHLHAHEYLPYHPHGVTCSGIVSSAVHRAFNLRTIYNPMLQTPADLEKILGRLGLEVIAVQST